MSAASRLRCLSRIDVQFCETACPVRRTQKSKSGPVHGHPCVRNSEHEDQFFGNREEYCHRAASGVDLMAPESIGFRQAYNDLNAAFSAFMGKI